VIDTKALRAELDTLEAKHPHMSEEEVRWLLTLARTLCDELDGARKRKPNRLPAERSGIVHKFQIGTGFEAYMNVGLYADGKPGEIFLTVSKAVLEENSLVHTLHALLDVIAIMTSAALQHGIPLEDLVRKFSFIRFDPSGFTNNRTVPIAHSVVDYVFRWLGARFLKEGHDAET